uniref:Uncharacterized protein n=1 Tax=Anguilla anguilla TaxID=7936 RepID=A0A0E9VRR0_ANGAN
MSGNCEPTFIKITFRSIVRNITTGMCFTYFKNETILLAKTFLY